jgi:hypothetical protein
MKAIMKRKNITWIIHVAVPASPVNPKAPARIPRIKKADKTQRSIFSTSFAGRVKKLVQKKEISVSDPKTASPGTET